MRCEHCGRIMRDGDLIHGIKYGTLTNSGFKAAQDSAVTVICGTCGSMLYKLIYVKLQPTINPSLYKTLTQTR